MKNIEAELIINGAIFITNLLMQRGLTLADLAERQRMARAAGRELDAADIDDLIVEAQRAIDSISTPFQEDVNP